MNWNMIRYFNKNEFNCSCCNDSEIDLSFVLKLDVARGFANIPFIITSGYRCITHNTNINGQNDSSHIKGIAADIFTSNSNERYIILNALLLAGFTRIGIADTFIHVDSDDTKNKEVVWNYENNKENIMGAVQKRDIENLKKSVKELTLKVDKIIKLTEKKENNTYKNKKVD